MCDHLSDWYLTDTEIASSFSMFVQVSQLICSSAPQKYKDKSLIITFKSNIFWIWTCYSCYRLISIL